MSEQAEKREPTLEAGSLILQRRPDEQLRTLTEAEYQILVHGDVSEEREMRNVYAGVSGSALIGFLSQLATVDWGSAFKGASKLPFILTGLLFAIFLAAAFGAFHCQYRISHAAKKSPYAWLRSRLDSQADTKNSI